MLIVSALSNTGAWNEAYCDPNTRPFCKQCVLMHCFSGRWKSQAISTSAWKWSFQAFFVAAMVKHQQFVIKWTRWSSPSKQSSYSATDSTSCDKQDCFHGTVWRQRYITTSKEYLTNSPILSKYCELQFFQLHLVKILCKLIIIWVNYERKKKGAFLWNTVYILCDFIFVHFCISYDYFMCLYAFAFFANKHAR